MSDLDNSIVLKPEILKAFESVPDLYLILSPDLIIQTASNAYLQTTLTKREEIVGKFIFEVFPDKPRIPNADTISSLNYSLNQVLFLKKQHRMGVQHYYLHKPGGGFEDKYFSPVNVPVTGEEGNVDYIIHKIIDVTERIKNEKKIQDLDAITAKLLIRERKALKEASTERNRLYSLFMQAPMAFVILNGPEYVIELANPAVREIWGRSAEEVTGRPLFEVLPEVKGQGLEELLDQVLATGEAYVGKELPVALLKNGKMETTYFNFIYHPLHDHMNNVSGIIAIATNVTDEVAGRNKVEVYLQELEQKNAELLKINADLDNFVYVASHDLKSPVANIEGLIDMLRDVLYEDNKLDDELNKMAGMIKLSAQKLNNTIINLIDINRIQRNFGKDIQDIKIKDVFSEIMQELAKFVIETDTSVNINVEQCPVIRFSRTHFKAIVKNLLENAIQFRSPHRHLVVYINCTVLGEHYILEIRDNGMGIRKENQEKIFQMFRRYHAATSGSGVGLYIARRIIEDTGGKIEVESEENVGSNFKIYLRK